MRLVSNLTLLMPELSLGPATILPVADVDGMYTREQMIQYANDRVLRNTNTVEDNVALNSLIEQFRTVSADQHFQSLVDRLVEHRDQVYGPPAPPYVPSETAEDEDHEDI